MRAEEGTFSSTGMWMDCHRRTGTILTWVIVIALESGGLACISKKSTSESGSSTSSTPTLSNINGATSPSSAVGQLIEINGSNFQTSSATVNFTQGSVVASATPISGDATDSSLVVAVPSGDSSTQFSVPGTVTVTVESNGVTTGDIPLSITAAPSFDIGSTTWTTTTALPTALTGLAAVGVPGTGSTAYVVVTGGTTGSLNASEVYSNTLNSDGTVGSSWTTITADQLPEGIAFHCMVEADASNSPVPANTSYIYVIGGQSVFDGAPGGTSAIYMASVNTSNGTVGSWTQLSNSLPQPLVSPTVTLYHGWIYVVGGLLSTGNSSDAVYSAQVNSNGTLGTWVTSSSHYPLAISFATSFGYGGTLFVLNGNTASATDPNAVSGLTGTDSVYYARVIAGSVGTWTESSDATLAARVKHNTWNAFGQLLNGEGIYSGSLEFEWSQLNSTGLPGSWTGLINPPHAYVYNAASVVSPLLSPSDTPRFLMLGGETVAGAISNLVYYNNAP